MCKEGEFPIRCNSTRAQVGCCQWLPRGFNSEMPRPFLLPNVSLLTYHIRTWLPRWFLFILGSLSGIQQVGIVWGGLTDNKVTLLVTRHKDH